MEIKDNEQKLRFYVRAFSKLRRDYKKGGAPHKPILLLSLIEAFSIGQITDKRIYITPELVGLFKTCWTNLVTTEHDARFALPFYHMRTEPFWKLIPNPGCEKWLEAKGSMRSFNNLRTAVAFAEIDPGLAEILKDTTSRDILKKTILEKYFGNAPDYFQFNREINYMNILGKEILEESAETYRERFLNLKSKIDKEAIEEEVFLRGGAFRREIPKIYNFTCCIAGLRIDATVNISMVDACHIIPFSESCDDTITNGLCLCPNLHRAFDRGIISIDDNYKVIVSDQISESESTYSIRQFEGMQIRLPADTKHYPKIENLQWHRKYHKEM